MILAKFRMPLPWIINVATINIFDPVWSPFVEGAKLKKALGAFSQQSIVQCTLNLSCNFAQHCVYYKGTACLYIVQTLAHRGQP